VTLRADHATPVSAARDLGRNVNVSKIWTIALNTYLFAVGKVIKEERSNVVHVPRIRYYTST